MSKKSLLYDFILIVVGAILGALLSYISTKLLTEQLNRDSKKLNLIAQLIASVKEVENRNITTWKQEGAKIKSAVAEVIVFYPTEKSNIYNQIDEISCIAHDVIKPEGKENTIRKDHEDYIKKLCPYFDKYNSTDEELDAKLTLFISYLSKLE